MIPSRSEIKEALQQVLAEQGETPSGKIYQILSNRFALTSSDLSRKTNGGESFFEKEVRWAKKDLVDGGIVKKPNESGHGIWALAAMTNPEPEDLSPVLCQSQEEIESALSKMKVPGSPPLGQSLAERITTSSSGFKRDARVVKYVLAQAAGKCEVCEKPSPFSKDNGEPFLEIHHVRRLAEGGSDTSHNAIAACPNCHRELHYGKNAEAIRTLVLSRFDRLKEE